MRYRAPSLKASKNRTKRNEKKKVNESFFTVNGFPCLKECDLGSTGGEGRRAGCRGKGERGMQAQGGCRPRAGVMQARRREEFRLKV